MLGGEYLMTNKTLKQMIESPPTTWEMTDDELIEELSRNGWIWDDVSMSRMEREIAITQEAVRRILAHVVGKSLDGTGVDDGGVPDASHIIDR